MMMQPCPNTLGKESNNEEKKWKWIGWLGAFLVVAGYYLNANMYDACWFVWIAGNSMVAGYSIYKEAYSTAAMSFIIVIMNFYGMLKW